MREALFALLASIIVTQIAVFSTTIYLHRTATHKALELHPLAGWMFRLLLWLTTGIRTKEWVAVHLKHHDFTEKEGDPHSPVLMGFWSVQLGNVFHYVREKRNKKVVEEYGKRIIEDAWDRAFFNHGILGVSIGTLILCSFLGWWGLFAAALHAVMYVFVLSSSINGLCHWVGYRNFKNTATNIRIVALLTGGEGLHNNHHAHPGSPKFSLKPSEFDPAWVIIKMLTRLGLAKPRRTMEEMRA